jgi:hypothetical protein
LKQKIDIGVIFEIKCTWLNIHTIYWYEGKKIVVLMYGLGLELVDVVRVSQMDATCTFG